MMMIPNESLALTAKLYCELQDLTVEDRCFYGILPEGQDFDAVCRQLDSYDLLESHNPKSRKLDVRMPGRSSGFFAVNLAGLIQAYKLECPRRFYIAELNYYHDHESESIADTPGLVNDYLNTLQLVAVLKELAEHVYMASDGNQHLVFLRDRKVTLVLDYDDGSLRPLEKLSGFKEHFIDSRQHQDQKNTIIKTSLIEVLEARQSGTEYRLSDLLDQFDFFVQRVFQGYELYVSEFSFKKVRQEVEKEKLEFIFKLNKVFSDIQNQLLAVPLALVLVGSQMELANPFSTKNIFIMAGMLAFTVFMDLLIRNQKNSLDAIGDEVKHQWDKITHEHKAIANRFDDIYRKINQRLKHQRRLIRIVDAVVAVSFVSALVLWISAGGLLWPF
ncbi:hypothetical protein ACUY1T_06825 [Billgrantia sp. Q4P2]|uniref:hypothetical protein n=1 Tax=Billgrantia sp. Q4P2 TaxID=3463857 RepID=UPI0040569F80